MDISVTGVDAAGEAVGYYGYVDGEGDQNFQGFVDNGGVVSAFNPPTSSNNLSIGITDGGEIFGTYIDNKNVQRGFVYNNGTFTNINVFLAASTTVYGVSGDGTIYGSYVDFANTIHGFTDSNGVYTTVDIPGYSNASVQGIDAAGEIVGTVTDSTGKSVGFADSSGSVTIFDMPGSTQTSVIGITSGGEVVGEYLDASGNEHGFTVDNGATTTISVAGAMTTLVAGFNDAGEVVGYFVDAFSNVHGFVDDNGQITQIDVPNASETEVLGVNDSGQIFGNFDDAQGQHGFVGDGFVNTPAVVADNPTVGDGQTVAVDPAIFTVNSGGIDEYEVWFSAANQGAPALGSLSNNGSAVALNKGVYLTSLSGLDYTGGATAGTDEMWLRVYNGSWSNWVQADITDPGGSGPVTVTANDPTVIDGQTVAVDAAIFSVGGSGISQYEVWFSAANQGAPALGSVTNNGTAIALNQGVYLNSLGGLDYTGAAAAGTDEMWLRAYDGSSWSSWVQADITDPGNVPPSSNPGITPATVTAQNPTVDDGQTAAVDPTVFTVGGSGISEYEVWFSAANQGAPALGSVTDNGIAIALNQGVYLTTLNGLDYTGGATAGTDEMWLRAYDGNWSGWVQADIADPGSSGAPEFQTSTGTQDDVLQMTSLMASSNAAAAAQLSAPTFGAGEPAAILSAGLLQHA